MKQLRGCVSRRLSLVLGSKSWWSHSLTRQAVNVVVLHARVTFRVGRRDSDVCMQRVNRLLGRRGERSGSARSCACSEGCALALGSHAEKRLEATLCGSSHKNPAWKETMYPPVDYLSSFVRLTTILDNDRSDHIRLCRYVRASLEAMLARGFPASTLVHSIRVQANVPKHAHRRHPQNSLTLSPPSIDRVRYQGR